MDFQVILQCMVVALAIFMGVRCGGVGLGIWGGVGLCVLTLGFGVVPTSPPIDVILIIIAVVTAASTMEASGGIDYLVSLAEKIIRSNPKQITIIAPLTTWVFGFFTGTSHICYPLQPVIYEVAHQQGIRPERPLALCVVSAMLSIAGSPVSAATAAMIGLFAAANFNGYELPQILAICVPSSIVAIVLTGLICMHLGKELKDDPEYQRRLAAGEIKADIKRERKEINPRSKKAAWIFMAGTVFTVVSGVLPILRTMPGQPQPLTMHTALELFMLVTAAVIMLVCKPKPADVPKSNTMQAGIIALIGIFGLAWLGDSFIAAHKEALVAMAGDFTQQYPWIFAIVLFLVSGLLMSQAATARALMPLGIALGINPAYLLAMFPAVGGIFFFPVYGTVLSAISFDRDGTTKIGKYILNHSFMLPGVILITITVTLGFVIANIFF